MVDWCATKDSFWKETVNAVGVDSNVKQDVMVDLPQRWIDHNLVVPVGSEGEYIFVDWSYEYDLVDYIGVDEKLELYKKNAHSNNDKVLIYTSELAAMSDGSKGGLYRDNGTGRIWLIYMATSTGAVRMTYSDDDGGTWAAETGFNGETNDIGAFNKPWDTRLAAIQDHIVYFDRQPADRFFTLEVINSSGTNIRSHLLPPLATQGETSTTDIFDKVEFIQCSNNGALVVISTTITNFVDNVSTTSAIIASETSSDITQAGLEWDERQIHSKTTDSSETQIFLYDLTSSGRYVPASINNIYDGVLALRDKHKSLTGLTYKTYIFDLRENNIGQTKIADTVSYNDYFFIYGAFFCGGNAYVITSDRASLDGINNSHLVYKTKQDKSNWVVDMNLSKRFDTSLAVLGVDYISMVDFIELNDGSLLTNRLVSIFGDNEERSTIIFSVFN